jgi:DNA-binding winged helix-turn-helix (wHTH) protein
MRPTCCHYCGQTLPTSRLGVKFTPIEGRIVDLVTNAGPGGISNDDIYDLVFGESTTRMDALKVHVCNINDKLADTGYQIVGRTVRCLEKTGGRWCDNDALSGEQQKALGL